MSKQWLVIVECKVLKQITCEDCSEEEAEEDPFEFAVDEVELEQIDWTVMEVKKSPV